MSLKPSGDTIDSLSWEFYDEGRLVRRQLSRRVVTNSGPWVTVFFLYQDLNRVTALWSPPKLALVRFRRMKDLRYVRKSHFCLNSTQAAQCIDIFREWLGLGGGQVLPGDEPEAPIDPPVEPQLLPQTPLVDHSLPASSLLAEPSEADEVSAAAAVSPPPLEPSEAEEPASAPPSTTT